MVEEGWKLPVVLNKACSAEFQVMQREPVGFRPRDPSLQPADVQARFFEPEMTQIIHNRCPQYIDSTISLTSRYRPYL